MKLKILNMKLDMDNARREASEELKRVVQLYESKIQEWRERVEYEMEQKHEVQEKYDELYDEYEKMKIYISKSEDAVINLHLELKDCKAKLEQQTSSNRKVIMDGKDKINAALTLQKDSFSPAVA
jgi:chromosome segregation ATPase